MGAGHVCGVCSGLWGASLANPKKKGADRKQQVSDEPCREDAKDGSLSLSVVSWG